MHPVSLNEHHLAQMLNIYFEILSNFFDITIFSTEFLFLDFESTDLFELEFFWADVVQDFDRKFLLFNLEWIILFPNS